MNTQPYVPMRRPTDQTRRQSHSLWRLLRAQRFDFFSLLRQSLGTLTGFLLVVVGTAFYLHTRPRLAGDPTSLDSPLGALYEALKLLTLQSNASFPEPGDHLGQVLFFLVPFLGLALIAQSVLNFGRFLLDKGSRREAWQIALASTYSDHIIVCGLGRVGLRVVTRLLDANYRVVVIEQTWQNEFVQRAITLGVPVVLGDARTIPTLRQAGIRRARGIIASIDGDLINVEIGLAAQTQQDKIPVILRAFDQDFDKMVERQFGTNSAFSASAVAAPTFAAAAVSNDIEYVLPLASTLGGAASPMHLLGVTQFTAPATLPQGTDPAGLATLRALEEHYGVRALRWAGHSVGQRGQSAHGLAAASQRRIEPTDSLTLVGPLSALDRLRAESGTLPPHAVRLQRSEQRDTVLVCGLGKVGYRVVGLLHQLQPRPRIVVVYSADPEHTSFVQQVRHLEGVTLIEGDARESDVLIQAGLHRAFAIAALTSDDLVNLRIGLQARQQVPNIHVVLRVFSDTLATRFADLFGIHTTYSTSDLASATLAAAAVLGGTSSAFVSGAILYAMDSMLVKTTKGFTGKTVESIAAQHNALVLAISNATSEQVLPAYATILAPEDRVTLVAPLDVLARLRGVR